jgi:adenylate kinase family enzyme
MKRVMVVGQPGAGKSWVARRIGQRTGLPVVHMDQIHWMPGWVERVRTEKIAMAHAVEIAETWVFEGGLSATMAHRLSRADTLVILDVPFVLRVWRVVRRTLRHHGRTRPDLPKNCPERFKLEFWAYIWRTRISGRQQILSLRQKAGPEVAVHVLRSRRAVTGFLSGLDAP